MIANNNQLSIINIHCVNNSTTVRILSFPVYETSCQLFVFITAAEDKMRRQINNIGVVQQGHFRKDGLLSTHLNISYMSCLPVGFVDSRLSFGVIIYDVVIFFSSIPSILLDSDHNKELIGKLLFNFIYVQYTYPIKLTYNSLTIYYIAVACLNQTSMFVDTFCCSDIAIVKACKGRHMLCSEILSNMTLEEVSCHYTGHWGKKQTFAWKKLEEVPKKLRPCVNSVMTVVKEAVGNIAFV